MNFYHLLLMANEVSLIFEQLRNNNKLRIRATAGEFLCTSDSCLGELLSSMVFGYLYQVVA